ncbi:MAG TPA: DedA family protein [Jatrophihabitantaceae bacterium]|jgi:membrane-associated protein|nr:DedA family protein [Jatrophihabitantaceae bacterium]
MLASVNTVIAAHAAAPTVLASAISPDTLIGKYGTIGLAVILFAECGLLIGFFLPGDTLLFSGGLLLATHSFKHAPPLAVPLIVLPAAAIVGNMVGYWIGRKSGPAVFRRGSRVFRPEYVERSEAFYDRFGRRAVLLARFVPVVRTVATVLAGVGKMRLAVYATYSIIGAIVWADGVFLIGYGLGNVSYVKRHQSTITSLIDPVIIIVVLLSLLPVVVQWYRTRGGRRSDARANEPLGGS